MYKNRIIIIQVKVYHTRSEIASITIIHTQVHNKGHIKTIM